MKTFLEYISEITRKFIKNNKTSRKFEILFCLHEEYIPGKNWQKIFDIISGLKSNTVLEWRGNYKLPKSEKLLTDYDTFVKIDENKWSDNKKKIWTDKQITDKITLIEREKKHGIIHSTSIDRADIGVFGG